MKGDKELFKLTRQYVMLMDLYRKARLNDEEFKEEINRIENTILKNGYDVDKFVEYQNLYKKMSMEDYYKFIKTLE